MVLEFFNSGSNAFFKFVETMVSPICYVNKLWLDRNQCNTFCELYLVGIYHQQRQKKSNCKALLQRVAMYYRV